MRLVASDSAEPGVKPPATLFGICNIPAQCRGAAGVLPVHGGKISLRIGAVFHHQARFRIEEHVSASPDAPHRARDSGEADGTKHCPPKLASARQSRPPSRIFPTSPSVLPHDYHAGRYHGISVKNGANRSFSGSQSLIPILTIWYANRTRRCIAMSMFLCPCGVQGR